MRAARGRCAVGADNKQRLGSARPRPAHAWDDVAGARLFSTRLLNFIQWDSFLSLSQTSRDIRRRLWARNTKEIVLSRFVPGYHAARRMRDPMWDDRFQLDLRDLELLSEL